MSSDAPGQDDASLSDTEQEPPADAVENSDRPEDVLIRVRDLRTYYEDDALIGGTPVKAVDGVSFDVRRGETLGIVGESGCGKTTLGRTLLQLEAATRGDVSYEGTDVTAISGRQLKEWRRNTQMVFQDPQSSLNDRMTVGEIVREPLDVHRIGTPSERRERVRDLLETVGLDAQHYFRYPHQFSGGQRQRVGIARALTVEPDFVVLDEPVSALDVSVQAEVLNLLEDLQDEFGLTYLFIAHDLSVVRHICDRVAVMYLGKIMELGPTEQLFQDPAHPYTHALLSAIPVPDPSAEVDRITLHGTPPSPRFPPAGCPFSTRCPAHIRPEDARDVPPDQWQSLIALREVLRERERAERTIRERIDEFLGRGTRFESIGETYDDLFEDGTPPAAFADELEQVADYVREGDESGAISVLEGAIGSECDFEEPQFYDVGAGRQSYCHRHDGEHRSVADVLAERHG